MEVVQGRDVDTLEIVYVAYWTATQPILTRRGLLNSAISDDLEWHLRFTPILHLYRSILEQFSNGWKDSTGIDRLAVPLSQLSLFSAPTDFWNVYEEDIYVASYTEWIASPYLPLWRSLWYLLTGSHKTPPSNTFIHKWTMQWVILHAFTPAADPALWLVSRPAAGRRLGWSVWLIFGTVCPSEDGHHPSTNWARRR